MATNVELEQRTAALPLWLKCTALRAGFEPGAERIRASRHCSLPLLATHGIIPCSGENETSAGTQKTAPASLDAEAV